MREVEGEGEADTPLARSTLGRGREGKRGGGSGATVPLGCVCVVWER